MKSFEICSKGKGDGSSEDRRLNLIFTASLKLQRRLDVGVHMPHPLCLALLPHSAVNGVVQKTTMQLCVMQSVAAQSRAIYRAKTGFFTSSSCQMPLKSNLPQIEIAFQRCGNDSHASKLNLTEKIQMFIVFVSLAKCRYNYLNLDIVITFYKLLV